MSTTESELDPFTAYLMENPPKDAIELRNITDSMILQAVEQMELSDIGESIDDVVIENVGGVDVTVDIHRPKGEGPLPILVYFHGGGWIMGSSKTYRAVGFHFAARGYLVFNVNYRLAPEHPFPAAYNDCVNAIRWVAEHALEYGGDTSRLSIGGDSAGGNLSAAAAATLDDDSGVNIRALLSIYPSMDFTEIHRLYELVPLKMTEMMVESYIGHDEENLATDWRVSPIFAVDRLPPTLVLCGKEDNALYDSEKLEQKLKQHDIEHEAIYIDAVPHAFLQAEAMYPQAIAAFDSMADFLNRRLS